MAEWYHDENGRRRFCFAQGRPFEFSEAIADEICERIANGETLIRICESEHIPPPSTIYRWMDKFEDFHKAYALAREKQADFHADAIEQISESADVTNPVAVQKAKLLTQVLQWRAGRQRPKKWGTKVEIKSSEGEFKDWTELATAAKSEESEDDS